MIDWGILNIEETTDESVITQAYRRMLTVTNPEDNPQEFMMLRRTYEEALDYARNSSRVPMENTNTMGETSVDNLDKTIYIDNIKDIVRNKRREVNEVLKEKKVLEKLKENQKKKYYQEFEQYQRNELDDISSSRYMRA